MANRNRELVSNTVILGIGQLVPKCLSVLLLPLLTAYLTTSEYGNYDLILSLASLLIPIVTMQIQQAVFRYLLATTDVDEKEKYVTCAITYLCVSSLIYYPVVFGILLLLGLNLCDSILICLLFCSEAFYVLQGQVVRGLGQNTKYSVGVIIYAVINIVFAAVFVAWGGMGLRGIILSMTFGYLGSIVYMVISTNIITFFDIRVFDKTYLKQLFSFCVPILPSSIALWVVNLSDRLIIIHFLGSASNGIYAVANKIPSLYSTAYGIFNLAWTETASKVKDDGDPAVYYSMMFNGVFDFLTGVMLVLVAATPIVFFILVQGGSNYSDALYQVPILFVGAFFNSFVNFYSGIYIAFKRTKQVGYSSILGAVLNAIINITLISRIGLYAASISTALSFMVIALYRAYDLHKVVKISYNYKNIALGMICFVTASICLYIGSIPSIIICWGMALTFNLTKNRKMLIAIMNKFIKREN